jgi:excisionase family DNA binding protein
MEITDFKEQLDRIETGTLLQKDVLTFDEACRFTGIGKSYMYKLTSWKKVPHFKPFGKMVYFSRLQLESWLLQNPVKTADEIEIQAKQYLTKNKKR